MHITNVFNAAALFPHASNSDASSAMAGRVFNGGTPAVRTGSASDSFQNQLVHNFGGALFSGAILQDQQQTSPLGGPPQVDKLGTQVRDYRNTLNAVRSDLVSQLKVADQALKQARQAGNQDAINDAQSAINGIKAQIKANGNRLLVIHNDVQSLREIRQKLSADVKAGYTEAAEQDRRAFAQQQFQLIADLQA
jgi:hypothetical protein